MANQINHRRIWVDTTGYLYTHSFTRRNRMRVGSIILTAAGDAASAKLYSWNPSTSLYLSGTHGVGAIVSTTEYRIPDAVGRAANFVGHTLNSNSTNSNIIGQSYDAANEGWILKLDAEETRNTTWSIDALQYVATIKAATGTTTEVRLDHDLTAWNGLYVTMSGTTPELTIHFLDPIDVY